MATKRALLVINASSRRGGDDLDAAVRHITESGWELTLSRPDDVKATNDVIRAHRHDVDRVILAGGDGTLHCALPAVLEVGLPLGILPLGTANDLATALGVPIDLRAAAAVFTGETERRVDVGYVNGAPFMNAAQVGLGAEVRGRLDTERKRRWGALGYLWAAAESLREEEPFLARVRCEGEEEGAEVLVSHITVANGERFGGRMGLGEEAVLESGELVAKALKPRREWSTASMAAAVLTGGPPPEDHVYSWRSSEITIETAEPHAVTADGEPAGTTPAHFRVRPGALLVLAPSAAARELQHHDTSIGGGTPERHAVDTVLTRARALGERLAMAADIISETGAPDLEGLLLHLAERQRAGAERLTDAVRAVGVLPAEPDADRLDLARMLTRLRTALARDESAAILNRCAQEEAELWRSIDEALHEELPEELKAPLESLAADAQLASAELARALEKRT